MSLIRRESTADREHLHARDKSVQSVDRAFDVLEALGAHDRSIGVTEIARLTGLPQGTVHRLLRALLARGYARRDAERKYAIGPAALRLGDASNRALVSISMQFLKQLVELAGETANLAVLEGTHMVYAAQSPSPHTLRIFAEVGHRVPVHSTAVGKVTLAGMDRAAAVHLLARTHLAALTPHTITSTQALLAELDLILEQGFAVDDEEQELGVRCVAVRVPDSRGMLAAISVSGPAERLSLDQAREIAPGMRRIAADLSRAVFSSDD